MMLARANVRSRDENTTGLAEIFGRAFARGAAARGCAAIYQKLITFSTPHESI
jgi:hypothetical protein